MALTTFNEEKGTDATKHREWVEARKTAFPDPGEVNMFRDYARGVQKVTLTPIHLKWLRGLRLQFCKNVLNRLLTAVTDRIVFKNWTVADDGIAAYLETLRTLNAADVLFAQAIYTAWRDGNSAISLSFDKDRKRVQLTRERFWNGEDGIFIAYDNKGNQVWSLNEWRTPDGLRRTWEDGKEMRRYINRGNGWEWFIEPGGKGGPIPTKRADGTPVGLMVVHFARNIQPADAKSSSKDNQRDSNYGIAFFANGMIALQDALNDTLKMISAAARFTAFQILWASGVEPPKKDDPKRTIDPGDLLTVADPGGKFGAIPAGSIAELLTAKDSWQTDLADSAGVPAHIIKGAWPSGEAILRAEAPLVDQCRKGCLSLAPAVSSVAHKATVLENTYNAQSYDETKMIGAEFHSPERYDPITLTKLANDRSEHISLEEIHRLYGYTTEQSKKIIEEMAAGKSFTNPQIDPNNPDDPNAPELADDSQVLGLDSIQALLEQAKAEAGDPNQPTLLPDGTVNAGTSAAKTLNGAQITAAMEVFDKLRGIGGAKITRLVAIEFCILLGVERATAEEMVDDILREEAKNPTPAAVAAVPAANPATNG